MVKNNSIRICICSTHLLFRESLSLAVNRFENSTVRFTSDFETAAGNNYNELDVIIAHFSNDPAQLKWIMETNFSYPSIKFVILADQIDNKSFSQLVNQHVVAILSSKTSPSDLEHFLNESQKNVNNLTIQLDDETRKSLKQGSASTKTFQNQESISFSKRELEIVSLVCQERTNSEIADLLGLSERTIETHRSRLIRKTNSRTIIGVIFKAIEQHNRILSL